MRNSKRAIKRPQKIQNMQLKGSGAGSSRDRGFSQSASAHSLNPYFNNNYIARWQEYVRWYMTSWEAKKIVDIPVQDALRIPVKLNGLKDSVVKLLQEKAEELQIDRQLKRALIQERLLGGSALLGLFTRPRNEETSAALDYGTIEKGDLKAVNLVDISRISRPTYVNDPFKVDFDRITSVDINGFEVHESRLCLFDGEALFNRSSQTVLENFRFSPAGFGESKLAPLYDILVRVSGTQQGAYHLVNLASCLIMAVPELRTLSATDSPAIEKLENLVNQISIYNAGIVDSEGVEFKNQVASFGSVPELVMSFLQILSAGSDIPASRFLGQAPGGLNATGTGDLENYYNNIAAWQEQRLRPMQQRLISWLGFSTFGAAWAAMSEDLTLEYASLWNLDGVQQSQVDNTYAVMLVSLIDTGVITQAQAFEELKKRKIFETDLEADKALQSAFSQKILESPFGEESIFSEGGENADIITDEQKEVL